MAEISAPALNSRRRVLPVVRWLQVGAAAASLGMAVAAAPAVAWADDSSAASDSASQSTARGAGPVHRSPVRHDSPAAGSSTDSAPEAAGHRGAGAGRVSAQTTVTRSGGDSDLAEVATAPAPAAAAPVTARASAATTAPAVTPVIAAAVTSSPAVGATAAASTTSAVTSAKAAAQAAPSAAPGLGSFGATLRLNIEDVISGTGKPVVTNPTAVVTGLFLEVLRRDPTATELQNYLNRLSMLGVNGVVAGLYTSDAFRQNAVNNYYLELLGRTPTQKELTLGALRLALGTEPNFAASLAGSKEFYDDSAAGGGKFGTQPSATTYVDLLYRSLLGEATGPSAAPLVQQVQGGLPISWAASQFVNTDAYRTVKVSEVYQVLGQAASAADIAGYVNNWLLAGGQGGISRSLLATSANVQRIEAGLVDTPDVAAAADLQKLLLSYYTDKPEGFTKLFNQLLSLDPNNPIGPSNPCSDTNASCNTALYNLVTKGGTTRGIPNNSLTLTSINANVATLIPTQNEIDMSSSLKFPLQNPDQLKATFAGGVMPPSGKVPNPVVTADGGTYIVDGHHRWSSVYLINPNTQIAAVDIGYVPTPQTALKEAQMGVVATKGYLASATVQGENLYTISQPLFDTRVRQYIEDGTTPDAVMAVFGSYLGFNPATTPLDDQYAIVDKYLWTNVLRMRDLNPYIPEAPSRSVMPQTDPLPMWQQYMDSRALSYSFPTISYLG
jgi:hypothetical protein